MASRGESRHVDADLADDDVGHGLTDARHRGQEVRALVKGFEALANARLHIAHGPMKGVDLGQMQLEQKPMMLTDTPAKRLDELRAAGLEPTARHIHQSFGVCLAGDQSFEFERTASRLMEMRSETYLALPRRDAEWKRGIVE